MLLYYPIKYNNDQALGVHNRFNIAANLCVDKRTLQKFLALFKAMKSVFFLSFISENIFAMDILAFLNHLLVPALVFKIFTPRWSLRFDYSVFQSHCPLLN